MLLLGIDALASRPVRAQSLQQLELEQQGLSETPETSNWNVTVGAGVGLVPEYPGADRDRKLVIPLAEIVYRNLFFLGPTGLGMNVIRAGGFRAGPIIGYRGGRSESDDPRLAGLGDIHGGMTAGLFATYAIGPLVMGATVRQAVSRTADGMEGLVRLDYRAPLGSRVVASFGPDIEFGDGQYERTWFGVSPIQSQDSSLPVFTPRAGIQDAGFHGGLTFRWTRHLLLRAFVGFRALTQDVAASPIVERRGQLLGGVGLAYHF